MDRLLLDPSALRRNESRHLWSVADCHSRIVDPYIKKAIAMQNFVRRMADGRLNACLCGKTTAGSNYQTAMDLRWFKVHVVDITVSD